MSVRQTRDGKGITGRKNSIGKSTEMKFYMDEAQEAAGKDLGAGWGTLCEGH